MKLTLMKVRLWEIHFGNERDNFIKQYKFKTLINENKNKRKLGKRIDTEKVENIDLLERIIMV